ncbi:hypothetical protein [Streptomyces sp. NPDC003635]
MTHRDMALLLAEAADGVEIGTAPTQAVIRGGRRRRARRWTVAAAAALVLGGGTGALAVTGLPGDGGDGGGMVATTPTESALLELLSPRSTSLAAGREDGKPWSVTVDVWAAPRDEVQAEAQLQAMHEYGVRPNGVDSPSELIGKSSYFVGRSYGSTYAEIMQNAFDGTTTNLGATTAAVPLEPDSDGPYRLVVGQVDKNAAGVMCEWKDGTSTEVRRESYGKPSDTGQGTITYVADSPVDWYVCLAPKGTEFQETGMIVAPLPEDAWKS